MSGKNHLSKLTHLLALSLALTALFALTTQAQKKKESMQQAAEIKILNVTKEDAAAKKNPNGPGRIIPVKLQWTTRTWPGAKLVELEVVLRTTNTDGSNTEVKKLMPIEDARPGAVVAQNGTLMLPMPDDVFAQEFTLTLNSKCSFRENGVLRTATSRAIKSGAFPVPGR
ncbi:MAG TPA: hypothetical protein VFD58_19585 [Blastocatellia bacterium]|nr:hypothetical protein [Blastocatellia bacterium]